MQELGTIICFNSQATQFLIKILVIMVIYDLIKCRAGIF